MNKQTAIFAGGCFWCTEAIYQQLKGVLTVMPGYSGGTTPNPSYEQVTTGRTGHAECSRIEFDADQISYRTLLTVFFGTHDPTTLNQQGNDRGTQYRSVIFYTTPEQKEEALAAIEETQKDLEDPIVTQLEPLTKFYEAEDYHQNYYARNPEQLYCQFVINPKLIKLKEKFSALLKEA
jgi:peptide-methionine (S)-S-oxide reductase